MKTFSIISLLLICMSMQSQIGLFGRDFLTGLLTTVKGKDFKLDDNCLSAEFDQNCENLADALKTGNLFRLISAASALKEELEKRCPSSDLTKIFNDTTALGVSEIMHRMVKFGYKIVSHLSEVFNDVKGVYSGIESKDFKLAGMKFGYFVKLTLDYSTI